MRVREGMILVATDFSKNKKSRTYALDLGDYEKKSFRMVLVYKAKPKVFLKW